MGYGRYVLPSGKEAGYTIEATCEHLECNKKIHRGMAYACGGEPGDQGGYSCEGYFCDKHRHSVDVLDSCDASIKLNSYAFLCVQCVSFLAFTGQIEEFELYRADLDFAPNDETKSALKAEGYEYLIPPNQPK